MKTIIFDLQGTLVENGVFPSPSKQVKFILGLRMPFQEYIHVFETVFMTNIHTNLSEGFKAVADSFNIRLSKEQLDSLIGIWNKNKLLTKTYPETIEVLESLKNDYNLVLVANIDCFSKDIITKFNLQKYFNKIYLSCDVGILKSNPEFFKNILLELNVGKEEAIMVGDGIESDMIPASKVGIRTILIDRRNKQEYREKINSLKELVKIL